MLAQLGYMYLVQLDPEHYAERVKLGYTVNVESRLADYRTSNPNAAMIAKWACKRAWERAAIDAITNHPSVVHVGGEVYDASALDVLSERANAFFAMLPSQEESSAIHHYSFD